MTDFLAQEPNQPLSNCITFAAPATEEVIRIDKEGFHYRGQFIADAGEAHRLMLEFFKQNTRAALAQPEPKPPSLKEQALAALTQYMTGKTILTKDSVDTIRRALEAMEPPEANTRAMTNLITPPSELIQRVATTLHFVTDSDPNVSVDEWMPEARAVIYIVAAWLREQEAKQ
jgi:hypothetical protein